MKQFLYLDNDIVNSIIAQKEKGLIQTLSGEQETSEASGLSTNGTSSIEGIVGGSILKLAKAEASLSANIGYNESGNSYMLISYDGYLVPLDDQYFRIKPTSMGFRYGGEITCVGMITNIIGEDTNPADDKNIFATLQFSVNEALRSILPTQEKNICVIHPIAVFYNR